MKGKEILKYSLVASLPAKDPILQLSYWKHKKQRYILPSNQDFPQNLVSSLYTLHATEVS